MPGAGLHVLLIVLEPRRSSDGLQLILAFVPRLDEEPLVRGTASESLAVNYRPALSSFGNNISQSQCPVGSCSRGRVDDMRHQALSSCSISAWITAILAEIDCL